MRFKTRATAIASLSARICAVPARKCVPMSGAHDLSVSNGTPKTVSNTLPGSYVRNFLPEKSSIVSESDSGSHSPCSANRNRFASAVLPSNVYVACTQNGSFRLRAFGRSSFFCFFDASASVASPNTFARSVADISSTRCRNAACPGWNAATGKTPA